MKKKQVIAVSSALMIGTTTALTGLPTSVMAQENTEVVQENITDKEQEESKNTEVKAGSIAIDEAHFPDKVFREQFIAKFDKDGDYMLSADEISEAKDLDLHDMTTISSLEGIQYLTNLQFLSIDRSSISDLSPVTNSSLKELNCDSSKSNKR